ncbi:pyridoxamine 5'-phosphate oxidase family protein [uncultured Sanguibacteroides sp.]|uniref:pyridoxamine 5'-phosphate oxidase family protein n=1 Tax=uncultured Sanguibacteroides sp. TaxID=1635151 RepID=UPI0025F5061D|nr:pyridoxamine 5'-phosphate oxidase family protein [uncultured Sanguibacteroides sp.]
MEQIRQKAVDMLGRCPVVMLASVDEEGYPRPVVMAKLKAENMNVIWMATGTNSEKTGHFRNNPKAGVCYTENGDMVALTGRVEVISDLEVRRALWQDWMLEHFPGGVEDPEYCVLKFTAEKATYYIANEFVKEKL